MKKFSDIDNHIKTLPNYEEVNQQHGHGDLSAALSLYKKFVEFLNQEEEAWWPSLDEYNPEISKEQWLELLKDRKPLRIMHILPLQLCTIWRNSNLQGAGRKIWKNL